MKIKFVGFFIYLFLKI